MRPLPPWRRICSLTGRGAAHAQMDFWCPLLSLLFCSPIPNPAAAESDSEIRLVRSWYRHRTGLVIGEIIARTIGANGFLPRSARADSTSALKVHFRLPRHGEGAGVLYGERNLDILSTIVE